MSLPVSVILVCAGADTVRAAEHGHPLLDLCFCVTPQGNLGRLKLSAHTSGNYIGISDFPATSVSVNPSTFVDDLLFEAKRLQVCGVFADIECNSPSARQLCSALDKALWEQNIPFFVPLTRAQETEHAILTVETAVSGGSLQGMISELQEQYGAHRIAALLRPVCADFCLPSENVNGMPLSPEACEALRQQYGAQVFFSHELCAKYFTYMEPEGRGHFVMFDDNSTLEEKIQQLQQQYVRHIFIIYPDAASML